MRKRLSQNYYHNMKLTSNPKPVKFRIVSGGEEHSSLDSLKHFFSIPDLQKIEKPLKQWLNRQGKEGNLIARNLEEAFPDFSKISSMDDYLAVYRIFYQKEFDGNKISNLAQLLDYWYEKREFKKNADNLIKLGFEKDCDITVFCYHKKISGLTDDWVNSLKIVNSPEADRLENELRLRNRWGVDIELMKNRISFYWHHGQYMDDGSLYSKKESDLMTFVHNCRMIIQNHQQTFRYVCTLFNYKPEDFSHKEEFHARREQDFLFDAKFFMSLTRKGVENFQLCKTESLKVYPPSKHLFGYDRIESYDNDAFLFKNIYQQIESFVLNHLFEY